MLVLNKVIGRFNIEIFACTDCLFGKCVLVDEVKGAESTFMVAIKYRRD